MPFRKMCTNDTTFYHEPKGTDAFLLDLEFTRPYFGDLFIDGGIGDEGDGYSLIRLILEVIVNNVITHIWDREFDYDEILDKFEDELTGLVDARTANTYVELLKQYITEGNALILFTFILNDLEHLKFIYPGIYGWVDTEGEGFHTQTMTMFIGA